MHDFYYAFINCSSIDTLGTLTIQPLNFRRDHEHEFPILASAARDILSLQLVLVLSDFSTLHGTSATIDENH